ncbi:MAG: carboxymethylenebutenolidase [Thermoproteota archaeon]|nr:carboxymethylenebutenolidase [Thermoproteota archaeon]
MKKPVNTKQKDLPGKKEKSSIDIEDLKYRGETGEIQAHFAKPKGNAKFPGLVVISEVFGLTDHIKDVAERVASQGYIALAPDALTQFGGTPKNIDEGRELTRKLDMQKTIKNFVAAVKYLKTHPQSTGKVGVVGFCWGGGMTNQVAVNSSEVQAAVPFYGMQPATEDVPKIKASLLLHYAGIDENINKGIQAYEAALKKAHVDYKLYVYEGALHGFFNDSNDARYNEAAAKLAWERTIPFFNQKLKT